ncbi:MAG: hypothetical protein K9G67_12860 [Bacteroidales bacterium]|nr:hypothetical protein [Bacteroidales bacterium]MCF8344090.1 hypothetical protein [Bacteroidales bacterium]MCF8350591.1 hypothetical protein [Bacteroidales bacterium]MCF8377241.1 hypothetical protein [Bacteroidales bacterium]MCF8401987.1 hypothetical protein [Bacteroidales bacterium]
MKNLLALSLFVLAGLIVHSQHESGFNFVESSTGMDYPQWESGMTELEFADIKRIISRCMMGWMSWSINRRKLNSH